MGSRPTSVGKFLHPRRLFTLFKYTVYALLVWNDVLFFQDDLAASAITFSDGVHWRNAVEAFSATIDTTAWIVLLLLFELETAVISDEKLQGGLKWTLMGIRSLSYFFIVYAFYGYCAKYYAVRDVLPFSVDDACSLVGGAWNYVASLDDYPVIDALSCQALQGRELFLVSGTQILGTAEALRSTLELAAIDIVNAATWLIIVVLLEVEVWMQIKDLLTERLLVVAKYVKGFFYLVLFVCAALWGTQGSFLDFWDAFLWLIAFIFIEMNIFQWHEETEELEAEHAHAA